ncbi:Calpain-D [Fusarium oxysporum f. sp. cubense race 1]|uniref:Calpain-D n=1 Tax=Fusarium oxysporum f. sp. cubense (strain race 1) TaxID=1229664 RepID=N4UYV3_FUSC1|nr:Calpain-D [Fusarium oxysporum f. sp. cubense race 1]
MRYRDPGWDLDWDLKFKKGHCLNNLESPEFKLDKTTFLSPQATVPKAVKRVHEIFENLQQIDCENNENVYRKTFQTGSKALFFAQCRDQNETWVPLFEKAFAKAHGDYASSAGGWIGEGIEDISGGVTTELLASDILDIDGFWDKEMSRVNDEFLFGASTGLLEHSYGERNDISEEHAYVAMEARTLKSGQRLVKLRNPWGKVRKGIWEGAWSDGSKEWTTECWIVVGVPWKAAYHEKFHIKLTRDSPLVLFLSQLNDRPNAEDYIDRSHGNYLMRRSVSVELPDLPAGKNEKLAQVGHAYDLAHSKVWGHMDKVTKLRQKKDQKKDSASRQKGRRQKERRRMWEKRATNRDVTKQQTKKNADKRKRRRAEWETEQNRLDEEFNAKVKAEREQMKKERLANAEAEKAAEAEKRAQEADDEALSKKAEEIKISEDKDERVVVDEHHKDHDDAVISVSIGSPHLTPKSMDSTAEAAEEKQEVPPVSGGPPAPIEEEEPLPTRPRPAYDSTGESSDSPIENWEELYSSDDNSRDPGRATSKRSRVQNDIDSDEEKMPEPWNAICIVGVRVYSKDENLELRTVMEGGELLEGGMGPKGAADLDNAQSNAGGGRSNDKTASEIKQGGTKGQGISLDISKNSKDNEDDTV